MGTRGAVAWHGAGTQTIASGRWWLGGGGLGLVALASI